MNLLDLLRAFGADESIIALAERWAARPAEGVEPAADYVPLTDEDLVTLQTGLQALGEDDTAGVPLLLAAADVNDEITTEQDSRTEAAEAEERDAEAARARLRGDEPEASDEGAEGEGEGDGAGTGDEGEGDEGGEAGDGDAGDGEGDEGAGAEEGATQEPEPVSAAALSRAARRQHAARSTRGRQAEPDDGNDGPARARIVLGPDTGPLANTTVEDLAVVDAALVRRAKSFRRAKSAVPGREEVLVASIEAAYPEDRRLGDDAARNGMLVGQAINAGLRPQALTAAGGLCAPLMPYYGVPVLGDDRRPVRDQALVGFQAGAARGGMTQIAPPILPDLAGSAIIWTVDDDVEAATDDEVRKPCLRIECGTPRDTEMHAVPLCLEFGNFGARTYGELTEAWTRLGMIGHARVAEIELLRQMKALSTKPNTLPTVVSAVRDTLVYLDQAATGFRSRHRLPETFPFRAVGPESWLFMARTDIARAMPGGSFQENLTLADAQIRAWFAARNISPTFTPDLSIVGQQAAATPLATIDPTMEWGLYPEGTFLFLDGGTLDLGVVRDSTLNSANDYQMWLETFEGVHLVGVEALWLTINTCPSGAVEGTLDPAALCASYT